MVCNIKSAKALTREKLISSKIIDKSDNILDIKKFKDAQSVLNVNVMNRFGISKKLIDSDFNLKVYFNEDAFKLIDAKQGLTYVENSLQQLVVKDLEFQDQSVSDELRNTLVNFLRSVNPNFKIEVLDSLNDSQGVSVNGVTKLNEFLIQIAKGKESALPEETAHVLVEMMDKSSQLFKEMENHIVLTKMYSKVLEQYGNHPEYKGNYPKLRREAMAKLISLYTTDRRLAEYYTGSSDLVSRIKSIIQNLLLRFKGLKNPFDQASLRILEMNTKDLLWQNALDSETMYQLQDAENIENFQTLQTDIGNYERVLINVNDSILDYSNYKIPGLEGKVARTTKKEMWFNPGYSKHLADYYANARLTKLGRELRDKIKLVGLSKFVLYTDAVITPELVNRIHSELGPVKIVRTGGETIIGEDEYGNPVIGSANKEQALLDLAGGLPTLIVDNRKGDIFKSQEENLDFVFYNNNNVKYTDYKELIKKQQLEQKEREFTEEVLSEIKRLDKDNIINMALPALNLIRNLVSRIEKGEKYDELSELFKDEFGNTSLPIDRAKQIIRQLEENSGEFEQGFLNFINSLGSTTLFWKNANAVNYESLRQLANGSKEDINKAIKESAILMRFILQWEDWLDSVQPIISDPSFEETSIIKNEINKLRGEIKIAKQRINTISVDVISKQLADVGKYYNEGKLAALRAGQITQDQYEKSLVTPQKIANIIFGLEGDLGMTSYFENALFLSNDLIQTISIIVEKSVIGANQESLDKAITLTTEVNKLQEKLGMTNEEIGQKITYLDKINVMEKDPDDSEKVRMVQKEALTFLNPFKDRWVFKAKIETVKEAKKQLFAIRDQYGPTSQEAKDAEKIYDQVYKDFKSWEKDNWHREMQTEPWEIYQAFGLVGEDFERAQSYQEKLWEERRALRAELRQSNIDEVQQALLQEQINSIDNTIKNLRNLYDVKNDRVKIVSDNPEEDVRIATILKEKHIIDRQLYEYKSNQGKFLKDLKEQILQIADPSIRETLLTMLDTRDPKWLENLYTFSDLHAPYTFVEWLENNTRVQYAEDFYESRKAIIEQITNNVKILSTYLSEEGSEELLEVNSLMTSKWEDLFNLSSFLRDEDGIFDASTASVDHQKLVKDVESEINLLKLLLRETNKKMRPGLTEADENRIGAARKAIGQAIERLQNIQSKNPTDYYHETIFEKLEGIYPKELGRVFRGEDFLQLINSFEFAEWLNSGAPSEFKTWFNSNHFIKTYLDENGKEVAYFQPTYIWMKIKPTDDQQVLLVPGYKYSDREFKDSAVVNYKDSTKFFQLKTEKNENTWDDVQNQWLPKSAAFRNEDYFRLKTSNPLLFEYLEKVSKFHIDQQKEAPRDTKLGYTLPYMNKTFTDGGGLASLWKSFTNRLNPVEEGEGNANPTEKQNWKQKISQKLRAFVGLETEEQEAKIVKTDLLGNKIQKIYTPYTIYLDPKDVTRDTLVSVLNYSEGLARTKALANNIPELNLLEQLLSEFNPFEKNTLNTKGQRVPAKTNRMLEVLRNLKKTQLYGDFKDYEMGEGIEKATMQMRKYTTFLSQSIVNPANAMKNYLQGALTNYVSGGVGDWADGKSITRAMKSPKTSYITFLREFSQGTRSLDFQLITLFNLSLSKNITDLYTGSAAKRNLKDLDKLVFMSSEATEFGVITSLLYSHFFHKKISINGETKELYDVFELQNGKLGLKANAYDGKKLIDQEYLNDLILKSKVITEQVQGKQWNPTVAQRFTLWRNFEFFKKYFIPKIRERFANERKNLSIGADIEGFYITTFKRFIREIIHYLDNGKLSGIELSPNEKRARALMSKELVVMLATYLVITFVFGYDDDDDEKFDKLKENSWVTNFSLMVLLNAKKETDSASIIPFFNIQENLVPPLLNETYNYVKEPFVGFGLFEQGKKLADAAFNHVIGGDSAYYDKRMPQYFIDKGESKFKQRLQKIVGYNDLLYIGNPNYKIQVQQQMLNL